MDVVVETMGSLLKMIVSLLKMRTSESGLNMKSSYIKSDNSRCYSMTD